MVRRVTHGPTRAAVAALALLTAVPSSAGPARQSATETARRSPSWPASLVDVAATRGVDFEHRFFPDGTKHMPENMGSGVALLDYDRDGDLDLYFVQGAPVVGPAPPAAANRLYRQEGDGRFVDVTAAAGVGDRGVGMGVSIGDINADGAPDLYITNYGANVLYRNRGDGRFEEVAEQLGVAGSDWSTGSAFVDLDGDDRQDLFVANYLDYDPSTAVYCGNAQSGLRAYCHPDLYAGQRDRLWLNRGGDGWEPADEAFGLMDDEDSRGLGVLVADLDGDGRRDLWVANDTTVNHLYLARGGAAERPHVEEAGLLSGVAVNGDGAAEASMGVAAGDLDGDGRRELFVTHLDEETNTLYRPAGRGLYRDATDSAALGAPSRPWVGFGTVMADFDLDGDLDLVVANGHIIDNIAAFDPTLRHAQPLQAFVNDGDGGFETVEVTSVPALVGRGVAVGDLDRDGDPDLVVTRNGGRALLLDNRQRGGRRPLSIALAAPEEGDWDSSWTVVATDRLQMRHLERAPSYLSQGAPEILLTIDSPIGSVDGRWRDGRRVRYRALATGVRYRLP